MEIVESSYYAEIQILVDGWPWNLSEFDFRRFFAPGCCPSALIPVAVTPMSRPSENRRVDRRHDKKQGKKRSNKKRAA